MKISEKLLIKLKEYLGIEPMEGEFPRRIYVTRGYEESWSWFLLGNDKCEYGSQSSMKQVLNAKKLSLLSDCDRMRGQLEIIVEE